MSESRPPPSPPPGPPPPPSDSSRVSLDALIRHVVDAHHRPTLALGAALRGHAAEACARHGRDAPYLHEVRRLLDRHFTELERHFVREEQVVFPYVLGLLDAHGGHAELPRAPFQRLGGPLRVLRDEHAAEVALLGRVERLTSGVRLPPRACDRWTALYEGLRAHTSDLARHHDLEELALFPRAEALERALHGDP